MCLKLMLNFLLDLLCINVLFFILIQMPFFLEVISNGLKWCVLACDTFHKRWWVGWCISIYSACLIKAASRKPLIIIRSKTVDWPTSMQNRLSLVECVSMLFLIQFSVACVFHFLCDFFVARLITILPGQFT